MKVMNVREQQQRKIKTQSGFLAALDQSGGSTPKALLAVGLLAEEAARREVAARFGLQLPQPPPSKA